MQDVYYAEDSRREGGVMMDAVKTGELIRKIRTDRKMTQQQLADQLHISVPAVSKYENGRGFPDISLLEPLSEALGISVSELLRGEISEMKDEKEAVKEVIQLAGEQQKRKLTRRTWTVIAAAAALFIGFCLCVRMTVRSLQKTETVLSYEECVNELVPTAFWSYECIVCNLNLPSSPYDVRILEFDKYTDREETVLVAVVSRWDRMTRPFRNMDVMVTYNRTETNQTRHVWFYNGDLSWEEIAELYKSGDSESLIRDSVLIYDRGY